MLVEHPDRAGFESNVYMAPEEKQKLRELARSEDYALMIRPSEIVVLLDENRAFENNNLALNESVEFLKTRLQKLEAALKILRDNRMHDSHVTKIAREALRQGDEK